MNEGEHSKLLPWPGKEKTIFTGKFNSVWSRKTSHCCFILFVSELLSREKYRLTRLKSEVNWELITRLKSEVI